jgi:CheY-like chemotaxis protein
MKKRILIIEDNHDLAESLVDILEVDDYEVTVKMSGKEGLAAALEIHPDLIILDIHMPGMNGYQVYRHLQRDDWGKGANVMILTASESTETIAKNINIPVEQVLFKPEISVPDLRSEIARRLTS